MSLDIWSRDDIRNVILAANAASADVAVRAMSGDEVAPDTHEHLANYRAGYEAALMTMATAFGIPLARRCDPGCAASSQLSGREGLGPSATVTRGD